MNYEQEMVRNFHWKFDVPAPSGPTKLSDAEKKFRFRLIRDELKELGDAFDADDYGEQIDALCDLLYVIYGCAVTMGVDLEGFFDEVHDTNMLKVGGLRSEDGKILKPEDWEAPKIRDFFNHIYGTDFPE
jgi:predicted HAD superfamily Cof-like phosphohydrolase